MATLYPSWPEHWVHVPCLGGYVEIDSGFIYRSVKTAHSIPSENGIFYLLTKACFIDTMGYAFTFHVVILLGRIPVGAYVHYPTISTDMLARVKSRTKWHTNTDIISSSKTLSHAKLL